MSLFSAKNSAKRKVERALEMRKAVEDKKIQRMRELLALLKRHREAECFDSVEYWREVQRLAMTDHD